MIHWQEFKDRNSDVVANGNYICSADEIGLILVSGADARDFLQNQLSNDIDLIDAARSW
jgi:folate-binding Fe-S cluster repair protein YgfZ